MHIPDEIHLPAPRPDTTNSTFFFITGNPGLIGHYQRFLTTIHHALNDNASANIAVYGRSLAGFELSDQPKRSGDKLLDMQGEMEHLESTLLDVATSSPASKRGEKLHVSLAGHSVGAYFLMLLLERYHAARREREVPYIVDAGICLFPTVVDIEQSPNGRKNWALTRFTAVPKLMGTLSRGLVACLGSRATRWIVGLVAGTPMDDFATYVTVAFMGSRKGVEQALYLAADEMRNITHDHWDDEVWGSVDAAQAGLSNQPKLFFYFGQKDGWVSEKTRDYLMTKRARQELAPDGGQSTGQPKTYDTRPHMEIGEKDMSHDFCIRPAQSDHVADKVAQYMLQVL